MAECARIERLCERERLPSPEDIYEWLGSSTLTASRLAVALRLCPESSWPGGKANHVELIEAVTQAERSNPAPGLGMNDPDPLRKDPRSSGGAGDGGIGAASCSSGSSSSSGGGGGGGGGADGPIRIFTDSSTVRRTLRSQLFEFTDEISEADVLFMVNHVKNFLELPITQIVSQFPFEGGLVRKDLLPQTVRRACYQKKRGIHICKDNREAGRSQTLADNDLNDWIGPSWWNPTFDLATEAHYFLREFGRRKQRQQQSIGNTWIVKAAQSSHALNYTITRNAAEVCNLAMARPGGADQVAQLYVDRPLLIRGHKFDLRMFVFVKSFDDEYDNDHRNRVDAYIHPYYYGRISPEAWDAAGWETWRDDNDQIARPPKDAAERCKPQGDHDYARDQPPQGVHFTTHENVDGKRMVLGPEEFEALPLSDFTIPGLKGKADMPADTWDAAILSCRRCLAELFSAVGPLIGSWPRSRAYYGCDIILEALYDADEYIENRCGYSSPSIVITPKLLEVNYQADLELVRTTSGDEILSEFLNDMFQTLFTDTIPTCMLPIGSFLPKYD